MAGLLRPGAGALPEALSRTRGAGIPAVARGDVRVATAHALRGHLRARHVARLERVRRAQCAAAPLTVLPTSARRIPARRPGGHRVQGRPAPLPAIWA